jgi:hypothetical protein
MSLSIALDGNILLQLTEEARAVSVPVKFNLTNKQEYVEEQELSEMEIDDGYLLVIKYSPEDDLVTVLKRLVDDPAD